jgi:hypothetical protein
MGSSGVATLKAAVSSGIGAVDSHGGRPDLAETALHQVNLELQICPPDE